ncbi:hypothetical protein [Laceyella putida]|uniref:Uncharacterized protein n=1 Tax=Laceyella putida TaxID=110101 RepID=A0ABW2RKU7_9BACL
MKPLSVNEMSAYLTSRTVPNEQARMYPHRSWEPTKRAALVILWGLLIYPQLDPDLRQRKRTYSIHVNQLVNLFGDALGENETWITTLHLLQRYDYIRMNGKEIVPGTGLFVAVDASKMYKVFRSSVLSRDIFRRRFGT